jgi:MFS family permease
MATDLKLTSNQYSIALVVFFVTYVAFEPPSNMLLVRFKPSIYLPVIMSIWGALTCVMAVIHDFKHLVALRIMVGVFEAGFAPGILLIISSWYKKEEQSVFTCQLPFFRVHSEVCLLVLSLVAWKGLADYVAGDGSSSLRVQQPLSGPFALRSYSLTSPPIANA